MSIKYSNNRYWSITLIILLLVFISGCAQQGSFKPPFKPNPPEASLAYTPTGNGWAKIFEGTHALTAKLTSDGGFIVFGTTMNDVIKDVYGWVTPSVYLFKTDSNGSVTWNITFNYAKSEPIGAVSQTADGGFVLVDSVYKSKSGKSDGKITDADILLTRITSDGSIVYNRTIDVYGKNTNDAAWLVKEASDGGFVIGGVVEGTGAYTLANGNTFLIKTDMKGNVLWTRTFELEENDFNRPLLLQQTQDKGFMIFGEIQSRTNNERYAYFIKTDSNGNKLWKKIFKRDEIGIILRPLIEQTPDGGYLVVGAVSTQINVNTSDERPSIHAYVMELDINGNTLAKKILNTELYAGDSIEKTSDGGYIVANEGVYLIKLDAEGNKMWERQMTDKDSEILEPKAYQTADGGYIIIGNLAYGWHQIGGGYGSGDLGVGSTAVVVIKVDENGHLNQTIYPRLAQRLPSPSKRVTGKGWNKTFGETSIAGQMRFNRLQMAGT